MKKLATVVFIVFAGLCLTGNAIAGGGNAIAGNATKEECMAKCKDAADMIKNQGKDATIAEVNKKASKFVWKDTYVFVMDLEGNMLAHPIKPALVGKNLLGIKDSNGKLFFEDFMKIAKSDGEGWVAYMWPRPGQEKASEKISYIYRVPGQNLITGAGIYK